MSARLEKLREMAANDPTSGFARYALAMELLNLDRAEEAVAEFRALLESDPNYSAAYFHGGRALELLNRAEDARALYLAGIDVTARNGDAHTRGELEAALAALA
jgi:tetratricopeptide (TPR) repeat protein